MPSTSGFDFSGFSAGMGGTSNNSAHDFTAADQANPSEVAHDAIEAKLTGKMTRGDFYAHLLEEQSAKDAREYETWLANTAWQRKVADLKKAGFSPLAALDATGQGAAVPTAQVAKASSHGANGPNILGAIITAIALIASKSITAAQSAKSAASMEAIKQSNRVALQAMKDNAAMSRAALHTAIANKDGVITKRILKY